MVINATNDFIPYPRYVQHVRRNVGRARNPCNLGVPVWGVGLLQYGGRRVAERRVVLRDSRPGHRQAESRAARVATFIFNRKAKRRR